MPEVEDEGEDSVRRRLESRGSAERSRAMRRSFWARRRGEGRSLAATTAIGGEGRAWPSWERMRETRGRVSEDERETWGSRGTSRRLPASAEAGGGRCVAGARRARAPAFWGEVGGDWRWPVGWAGTVLGQQWPR